MVKRLLGAKTKLWSTTRVKGPFLSLILTIVFPDGITLICKIFADGTHSVARLLVKTIKTLN